MSSFTFFLLCVQACLIQAVFGCGNCDGASGAASGWSATTYGAPNAWAASTYSAPSALSAALPTALPLAAAGSLAGPAQRNLLLPQAYTATGTGYTAAAGELPIAGSTLVAGRVPVSGATIFEGLVPAAGSVSISGHCGCSCYNDGIYY